MLLFQRHQRRPCYLFIFSGHPPYFIGAAGADSHENLYRFYFIENSFLLRNNGKNIPMVSLTFCRKWDYKICEESSKHSPVWKLMKLHNIIKFKSLCSCVVKGYREEVYISCAPYIFAMAMKCIISISISNLNDHVTFIWGFLMLLLAIICQTFLSNCQRTPHEVIMWMTRRNKIVKTLLFAAYNFALVINSFNIFMW